MPFSWCIKKVYLVCFVHVQDNEEDSEQSDNHDSAPLLPTHVWNANHQTWAVNWLEFQQQQSPNTQLQFLLVSYYVQESLLPQQVRNLSPWHWSILMQRIKNGQRWKHSMFQFILPNSHPGASEMHLNVWRHAQMLEKKYWVLKLYNDKARNTII